MGLLFNFSCMSLKIEGFSNSLTITPPTQLPVAIHDILVQTFTKHSCSLRVSVVVTPILTLHDYKVLTFFSV